MKNRREGSLADLSQNLPSALSKLGATDTQQKGLEEVKDFLRLHKLNDEKLSYFLSSLTPSNEHMLSLGHKREFIKLYGTFAEVLESEALPYLPKIFAALLKKLKESNLALNESISLAYGSVIHNTLHTLPDLPSSCSQLLSILKPLFECLLSTNKALQVGSGLCITKIIQHSPLECLRFLLDRLTMKLLQVLNGCKAQCQVVESLISLILSVEQEYAQYTAKTVPELLACVFNEDFLCRKQVVEALYTLAAVVPASVAPYASEIMNVLNKARTDKAKPVRESAVEAMNLYKKMVPDQPPAGKIVQKSPKEEVKPKSIFRGPVNANFFKAANSDLVVEAPERPQVHRSNFREDLLMESPRSISPSFREHEADIEKFGFEQDTEEVNVVSLSKGYGFERDAHRDLERGDRGFERVERGHERVERGFDRGADRGFDKAFGNEREVERGRVANQGRVEELKECCKDIKSEFGVFREHVRGELTQINQRLGALEEMISTVSQLFDAKLKQITCNPNIANLLRN